MTAEVQAYLREALGVDVRIRQWSGTKKLPYFLQDAFDLHELQLRDRQVLLASARKERLPALSTLRVQLDKLEHIAARPVVLAATTLASFERKRLVEQKVPFVVPGNQLYLPDLGIDFREYFRQPPKTVTAFSPATQAMFISALLDDEWHDEWQPAVRPMGYTPMTLSRAVRELAAAGLLTASQTGRTRRLRVKHPRPQAWEHAAPFLRNPVKGTVWVGPRGPAKNYRFPQAGLSALAYYSMLAEPPYPIYALTAAEWKEALQTKIQALHEPQSDATQWQVWSYSPTLKDKVAVDPLSLTLSLKDDADDRVQKALVELRDRFPW